MCFRSAQNDYAVGLGGDIVKMSDRSVLSLAESLRLHSRLDRRTEFRLVDAESVKYLDLSCLDRAAVAAHRRHDKRVAALLLDRVDDAAKQLGKPAHSAAAGRDGDPIRTSDPVEKSGVNQLLTNAAADVCDILLG